MDSKVIMWGSFLGTGVGVGVVAERVRSPAGGRRKVPMPRRPLGSAVADVTAGSPRPSLSWRGQGRERLQSITANGSRIRG